MSIAEPGLRILSMSFKQVKEMNLSGSLSKYGVNILNDSGCHFKNKLLRGDGSVPTSKRLG